MPGQWGKRRRRVAGLAGLTAALTLASAAPAAAAPAPPFAGIYTEEPRTGTVEERLGVLRAHAEAGAGLVRLGMPWTEIELIPGYYDWTSMDRLMEAAARSGVSVLPVLISTPAFYSSAPSAKLHWQGMWPPEDPADLARFAAAAVDRYGAGGWFWLAHPELPETPIRSWQVWNEPNVPFFWPSGPDAAEYVRLLRPVANAIRAADPQAEVVSAGIPSSRIGMPLHAYLEDLYDAGVTGTFDVLAIHPYAERPLDALVLLEQARTRMDQHGDDSPIWATEFGWATDGSPSPFTTDEATQAAYLWEAIHLFADDRTRLKLRGLVVYNWQDARSSGGNTEAWPAHAGLHRLDGSRKPGYSAFRGAVLDLMATGSLPAYGETIAGGGGSSDTGSPGGAASRLRIVVGRSVRARGGKVPITLSCSGDRRCRGTLWLQRRWRRGLPRLALGHRTFTVGAGRSLEVRVKLTRRARRVLRRRRAMRASAGATVPGAAAVPARFRLLSGAR